MEIEAIQQHCLRTFYSFLDIKQTAQEIERDFPSQRSCFLPASDSSPGQIPECSPAFVLSTCNFHLPTIIIFYILAEADFVPVIRYNNFQGGTFPFKRFTTNWADSLSEMLGAVKATAQGKPSPFTAMLRLRPLIHLFPSIPVCWLMNCIILTVLLSIANKLGVSWRYCRTHSLTTKTIEQLFSDAPQFELAEATDTP